MIHTQNHECDIKNCPWHERDRFIADIAALHTADEGVVDHVQAYCLDKLIRRARALEGKA